MKTSKFRTTKGYSHDDKIFNVAVLVCYLKLKILGAHILITETNEGGNFLQLPFQIQSIYLFFK